MTLTGPLNLEKVKYLEMFFLKALAYVTQTNF